MFVPQNEGDLPPGNALREDRVGRKGLRPRLEGAGLEGARKHRKTII